MPAVAAAPAVATVGEVGFEAAVGGAIVLTAAKGLRQVLLLHRKRTPDHRLRPGEVAFLGQHLGQRGQ